MAHSWFCQRRFVSLCIGCYVFCIFGLIWSSSSPPAPHTVDSRWHEANEASDQVVKTPLRSPSGIFELGATDSEGRSAKSTSLQRGSQTRAIRSETPAPEILGETARVSDEKMNQQKSTGKPTSHGQVPSAVPEGIPCIVHQSWKTRKLPSERAARWRKTWSRCLPDCQHILWTDADNLRLVENHFPWLLPVYNGVKSGVQRADIARILYLVHQGGIYADIDTVCVRDFRHLLRDWSLVFGGMEGHWYKSVNGSYVQNSFMASVRGHPFWLGLLHRISRRHRKKLKGGAEEVTGPLILMEELQEYLSDKFKDAVVFPPSHFNPFSWITNKRPECKIKGAMSESDAAACLASFPNAYVVQMHSKTWGGGKA